MPCIHPHPPNLNAVSQLPGFRTLSGRRISLQERDRRERASDAIHTPPIDTCFLNTAVVSDNESTSQRVSAAAMGTATLTWQPMDFCLLWRCSRHVDLLACISPMMDDISGTGRQTKKTALIPALVHGILWEAIRNQHLLFPVKQCLEIRSFTKSRRMPSPPLTREYGSACMVELLITW
jgi:hypothetical protein